MDFPATVIPIVAIVMCLGMPIAIVAIVMISKARQNAELQKTLRMSIEKGQPLPQEFLDTMKSGIARAKNPMNDVRAGIILIAIAAGLMIWNYIDHGYIGGHLSGIAAIPGLIGVALLILGIIGMNSKKN